MIPVDVPTLTAEQERLRLGALSQYEVLDLPAEPELGSLLTLATALTGASMATINIFDADVQYQYATTGFDGCDTDRQSSMCETTLRAGRSLYTPNASLEPAFAQNPWVTGELAEVRMWASSPICTPEGAILGTVCAFDFEVMTLTEPQLAGLDAISAQIMALLERRRLARRANEATEAKAAFVAAVSHELRTPLHAVMGMLQVLERESTDASSRAKAKVARRSSEVLLALVNDVLAVSKGEATLSEPVESPFAPGQLLTDLVELLGVLATEKGTMLTGEAHGEVPLVLGDAAKVRQILVNLVGNALKFTETGGVTLALLDRGVEDGEATFSFEVRDTGAGMDEGELSRLFEPFVQGAMGRKHGGTGLGLTIAKQLSEQLGAKLSAVSTPGRGSTFTLTMTRPVAAERRRADRLGGLAGKHFLVVDDDQINRMVAEALLESVEATCVAVATGAEAAALLESQGFDAILMDVELGNQNGADVTQDLRALGVSTRILGLTGHASLEVRDELMAAGMDGVLTKPLQLELLAAQFYDR